MITELESRIQNRKQKLSLLDVQTNLKHFALINYALPKDRLKAYIPTDRFEIPEFMIQGKKMALMSVVPFLDSDFNFARVFPYKKFSFMQTNYRVYVFDKITKQHCAWFFGTTLGSYSVLIPNWIFNMPWYFAKYKSEFLYNTIESRYQSFKIQSYSKSIFGNFEIEIEDSGVPIELKAGFENLAEMKLILTHPIQGFFYRNDKKLGGYSIWHDEIFLSLGKAKNLYFEFLESMQLLSKSEMQNPHSIFMTPEIFFEVYFPPSQF